MTPGAPAILAFCEARVSEKEQRALEAAHLPGKDWDAGNGGRGRERDGVLWDEDHANIIAWFDDHLAAAVHAAANDPRQALREVTFMRAVLERHRSCILLVSESDCPELRALAAIWDDHEDYREGWAG